MDCEAHTACVASAGAVRRLIAGGVIVAAAACAQPGAPPGGPPDAAAPVLVSTSPDTNATGVTADQIDFRFDEIIREGPATGQGSLASFFVVSPREGEVEVSWRRSRLEVKPDNGFRPGVTYTVTLLPGLTDLRGNRDSSQRTIVFSTGPTIDSSVLTGAIFDWVAGRPVPRGVVEAISLADTAARDSLIYFAVADSTGRYAVRHMRPGQYLVRGFIDQNRDFRHDSRELFDTATVTLTDSLAREILAFSHDSAGPGINSVSVLDSLNLRVEFDRAIDPGQEITTALFALQRADSTPVVIVRAEPGPVAEQRTADSLRAIAARDSMARAASLDSARRADSLQAAAAGRRPPSVRAPAPVRPGQAATDSTPPLRPSRPSPFNAVVLRVGVPLVPEQTYRLSADSVRNMIRVPRTSTREFTIPARAAPDSTPPPPAAPPDTVPSRSR